MTSCSFIFCLILQCHLSGSLQILSKLLQGVKLDLIRAHDEIKIVRESLEEELQNDKNFDQVFNLCVGKQKHDYFNQI